MLLEMGIVPDEFGRFQIPARDLGVLSSKIFTRSSRDMITRVLLRSSPSNALFRWPGALRCSTWAFTGHSHFGPLRALKEDGNEQIAEWGAKQSQQVEVREDVRTMNFFGHTIEIVDNDLSTMDYVRSLTERFEKLKIDDPFYVMDIGAVFRKHAEWCEHLPGVQPYYAVKCNNDSMLTTVLSRLGYGFDCASLQEIRDISTLGVGPRRIIYANPYKTPSHLRAAAELGVRMTTVDNESELLKIRDIYPEAQLLLRIATDESCAMADLSKKFGCDASLEAPALLRRAAELGLDIAGICFHVGSDCRKASAYDRAISDAAELFAIGLQQGHRRMQILDIGGGYPGKANGQLTFPEIAKVIRSSIEKHFPTNTNLRVVGEPGRFYATSAYSLCANVIGRKAVSAKRITDNDADVNETGYMYYLNDGIYGSFSSILIEGPSFIGEPILLRKPTSSSTQWSTLWGPTCDNADCVVDRIRLPKLEIGDWLAFDNMGAYSIAIATEFNGFKRPKVYYTVNEKDAHMLQNMAEEHLRSRCA